MNSVLEEICTNHPEFTADCTPPWGLPTAADFDRITAETGFRFPPTYIDFQTTYAARLPIPDNGFRWANSGLEPYLSLESTIQSARDWGVSMNYIPFWDDEGNFCCFDSTHVSEDGECPIVFWDHEAPSDDLRHDWATFADWLSDRLIQSGR